MTRYLKNIVTGVVFVYSDIIAKQPEMHPYDPEEEAKNAVVEEPVREILPGFPVPDSPVPFAEFVARGDDGPLMKDVIKLANHKKVTMDKLDKFHPKPSDFTARYAHGALRLAVIEFKRRAVNGE